jgi:hypothetical protein
MLYTKLPSEPRRMNNESADAYGHRMTRIAYRTTGAGLG